MSPSEDKKTVISFDLDDTLIESQSIYDEVKDRFSRWLQEKIESKGSKKIDITSEEIQELQKTIDHKYASNRGFNRERFPHSLTATTLVLADYCNSELDRTEIDLEQEELNKAYEIGDSVFHTRAGYKQIGMFEGAEEVLDYLDKQDIELMLVTLGDQEIQRRKIEGNNLEKWFDESSIHIVDKKEPETYQKAFEDHKNSSSYLIYHVGNSMKSDVIPAQRAGIRTIHIPQDTWSYNNHKGEIPDENRYTELNDIKQIKQLF